MSIKTRATWFAEENPQYLENKSVSCLKSKFHRNNLAALLHNCEVGMKDSTTYAKNFEKAKSLITQKIFSKMSLKDIVSFHAMPICDLRDIVYYMRMDYASSEIYDEDVKLVIDFSEVELKRHKLNQIWNGDIEQLSSNLANHYDRLIIKTILDNCNTKMKWDWEKALGDTIKERYESLYIKMIEASNIVHRKTLRSGVNFIITTPEIESIFQCSGSYGPIDNKSYSDIRDCGVYACKWRIYSDPEMPKNKMILGYKGDSYMDTGIAFATSELVHMRNSELYGIYEFEVLKNGGNFYATIDIENLIF